MARSTLTHFIAAAALALGAGAQLQPADVLAARTTLRPAPVAPEGPPAASSRPPGPGEPVNYWEMIPGNKKWRASAALSNAPGKAMERDPGYHTKTAVQKMDMAKNEEHYEDEVNEICKKNGITDEHTNAKIALRKALMKGRSALHLYEHDVEVKWNRIWWWGRTFLILLFVAYVMIVGFNEGEFSPCVCVKTAHIDEQGALQKDTSFCVSTWFNDRDDTEGMRFMSEDFVSQARGLNALTVDSSSVTDANGNPVTDANGNQLAAGTQVRVFLTAPANVDANGVGWAGPPAYYGPPVRTLVA